MSCKYLKNVLSRQDNSKTILRCLEDNLCRLGNHVSHLKRLRKSLKLDYRLHKAELDLEFSLRCKNSNVTPNVFNVRV